MIRNNGKSPIDLNLSLSSMGGSSRSAEEDGNTQDSTSLMSLSLYVPSKAKQEAKQGSKSLDVMYMVLATCPRCLTYVILDKRDPSCPRCLNTAMLDFLQEDPTLDLIGENMRSNNGKSRIALNPSLMSGSSRRAAEGGNTKKLTSSLSLNSCGSSEEKQGSKSPKVTSMVMAACLRCIMYVMLDKRDPNCPKCLNPAMLDFLQEDTAIDLIGEIMSRNNGKNPIDLNLNLSTMGGPSRSAAEDGNIQKLTSSLSLNSYGSVMDKRYPNCTKCLKPAMLDSLQEDMVIDLIGENMNRNNGKSPIDLNLNLSTTGGSSWSAAEDGNVRKSTSSLSPRSSMSSKAKQGSKRLELRSMVPAACPRCLMYVMFDKRNPKCPKCLNPTMLELIQEKTTTKKMRKT